MQTRIFFALMAVVAVIGLSVQAQAQTRERVKVQMGQEFVVRGVTLPAGEYELRQLETNFPAPTLSICGANGHAILVPVRMVDLISGETAGHPTLVLLPEAEGLTLKRVLLGGRQAFEVIQTPDTN